MNLIAVLFLCGLLLLGFEIFVPGAVLGILGAVALIAGCVAAFFEFGRAGGITASAVAVALAVVTLVVEFWVLPKTSFGKRLFLRSTISGKSQAVTPLADSLVGKPAEAVTALAPSGYVEIDGKRYEAVSLDGLIDKGARLRVSAYDNFTLKVSRVS